jgi:hypothetical protein
MKRLDTISKTLKYLLPLKEETQTGAPPPPFS